MKLWLARHAQPLIGKGICYGVTDVAADVGLTTAAAKSLAASLPEHTVCRVSPLRRCQQLAAALAVLRPDLAVLSSTCTDMRLQEVNFGHFEDMPWAQIPKSALDAWTADFGKHRFGGVESANDVLQRVKAAFDDTLALKRNHVLWITHAGVIRACSLVMQGIHQVSSSQQWPQAVVEFGSCVTIDYD